MFLNLSSLQILAVNADNVSSNDTQGQALVGMANSFELENHVRCFNHTLQLSAKTLLRPFNVGLGKTTEDGNNNDVEDLPNETVDDEDEHDEDDGLPAIPEADDIDDGIDELEELEEDEREDILTDTAAVRDTVTKVCVFFVDL